MTLLCIHINRASSINTQLVSVPEFRVLVTSMANGVRINDALDAVMWLEGGSIVGRTVVSSKDKMKLSLYCPAEGYLGPWPWVEEHLTELETTARSAT